MTKKKLSNSVLQFKEKCPCGTEIEFESSTGMVFDKMMQRWDKAHTGHVFNAAHPQEYAPNNPAGRVGHSSDQPSPDPRTIVSDKMLKSAQELEKVMLGAPMGAYPPSSTWQTIKAEKQKKNPSVVEMEEASRKAWAEMNKHERERITILQRLGTGAITQDDAEHLLEEVNRYERREQEQSKRDQGATTPEGDAASSRV